MPFTEIQTDAANQYDWSEILTEFNDDGTIAMIQTLYDNGHFIGEVFALTGELSMVIRKDKTADGSLYSWQEYTTRYDIATGQVSERNIIYDDATERLEIFVDGTRAQAVQTDPTDVKSWTKITTDYAADGTTVARRQTDLDYGDGRIEETDAAGTTKTTFLEDGVAARPLGKPLKPSS